MFIFEMSMFPFQIIIFSGKQLRNNYESEGGLVGSTCGITIWSDELSPHNINMSYSQGLGEDKVVEGTDNGSITSESEAEATQKYQTQGKINIRA